MAAIEDLIKQIADPGLRDQLAGEVARLKATKTFGLVFEEHLPELVRLPALPVRAGVRVVKKDESGTASYRVTSQANGKKVKIVPEAGGPEEVVERDGLVVAKAFGEPMYPALVPVDAVERAPGKPWHVLINADNFHALQLLLYGYEGKVDVIYIDPPYNTGARDWKYNNNYVDKNDLWRHSKWLSMMEKRLRLAKRLLKHDGILIATIDENEVHHLGLLLQKLFPDSQRQMVSICINPSGASGEGLSRVEEYAFFCFLGNAIPARLEDDMLSEPTEEGEETDEPSGWESLLRRGNAWYRRNRPNLCYPVLIDRDRGTIEGVGKPFEGEDESKRAQIIDGFEAAWPVRKDNKLGIWRVDGRQLVSLAKQGYAYATAKDMFRDTWTIRYLMSGTVHAIANDLVKVTGRGDKGQVLLERSEARKTTPKTIWHRGRHTAGGAGGTQALAALLGRRGVFPFPKSIYSVRDCLAIALANRSEGLVLDFFAGSGTTLNALAILNAEDSGTRRSILVTNNEVSEETAKVLLDRGAEPATEAWEREGVCESATWPRIKACLSGVRSDGTKVPRDYLDGRPMSEGFQENAAYFKLDFLDPGDVTRGEKFESIVPILWMLAGCRGKCEVSKASGKWFMPKHNPFAVLHDEDAFGDFVRRLAERPDIDCVFLVTDSTEGFHEMAAELGRKYRSIQLYRSYIDTFRINLAEPGSITPAGVPIIPSAPATSSPPAQGVTDAD